MEESRKSLRFRCNEMVLARIKKTTFEAKVTDVSRGGLKLQTERFVPTGASVWIRPLDSTDSGSLIQTFARWIAVRSPYEVGLEFAVSSHSSRRRWLNRLVPTKNAWSSGEQSRADVRVPASLPVLDVNNPGQDGVTLDISRTGASVLLDHKLDPSAQLYLCLPWDFLQLKVDVVRVEQEDDQWIHGVRFQDSETSEIQSVRRFVKHFVET